MAKQETDIDIDLWPAGRWKESDLEECISLLRPLGTVNGRLASDTRGLDIETIIVFATGAIIAGFLAQIGTNLSNFTGRMIKLLMKRVMTKISWDGEEQLTGSRGRLTISYEEPSKNLWVAFNCVYSSDDDLRQFFEHLTTAHSELLTAIQSYEEILQPPSESYITAEMQLSQSFLKLKSPTWNVHFRHSNAKRFITDEDDVLIPNPKAKTRRFEGTLTDGKLKLDEQSR